MNYYPELIKSAFEGIVGAGNAKIVSLVHDAEQMDGPESGRKMGQVELPASFMISDSSIVRLAGSEQFVDDALVAIGQSDSNCVFAFPPLLGRMKLSDSFRSRFGQLTVVEAFAQSLIESGRLQALAMLVPTSFLGNSSCGSWRRDFFPSQSALVSQVNRLVAQRLP